MQTLANQCTRMDLLAGGECCWPKQRPRERTIAPAAAAAVAFVVVVAVGGGDFAEELSAGVKQL